MPIPLGILAVAGAGAAGGVAAYDLLETTVLTSAAASFTFSNLNNYSDYKHLEFRFTGRSNTASANLSNLQIRFNSATNGYAYHRLSGDGASVSSSNQASTGSIILQDWIPGANAASGIFGAGIIQILDFSNTNKNKTLRSLNGGHSGTGNEFDINLHSGLWDSTSAITSIELESISGSFITGSRFSLYGIRG